MHRYKCDLLDILLFKFYIIGQFTLVLNLFFLLNSKKSKFIHTVLAYNK